jgi:hypothetical protein
MTKKTWSLIIVSIIGFLLLICLIVASPFLNYALLWWGVMPSTGRIKLWVKVVDQNGTSVPRFSYVSITGVAPSIIPFLKPTYISAKLETDEKGLAYYDSKKSTSLVYFGTPIESQGYLQPKFGETIAISYSDLYGKKFEGRRKGTETAIADDPIHPIIVTVYKHGPPQKLISFGDGGQTKYLNEEDKYVNLNISEKRIWGSKTPEGDIAVRVIPKDEYEKLEPGALFGGYEFIAGKEAGITQVWDNYHVECPEESYQTILVYPKDFIRGGGAVGTEVYFYCKKREIFGFLHFGNINFERKTCQLNYIANVKGNRCLYYEGYR